MTSPKFPLAPEDAGFFPWFRWARARLAGRELAQPLRSHLDDPGLAHLPLQAAGGHASSARVAGEDKGV